MPSIFPLLYRAHHSLHPEDLPFWLELARRQAGPALELGCGTGRVLLALAAAGCPVCGLDIDAQMLAVLRADLTPALRPRVRLLQADLTRFCLAERFTLILLPCNTYSTLAEDDRPAALALVRRHLRPEGLFAVSLPNPALLAHMPRRGEAQVEEIFSHPLDGEPVQVSSAWERDRQHFSLTWHYDHLLPNGRVERLTTRVIHSLALAPVYEQEFRAAGLQIIETYGDFDRSPYTKESPYLIWIAAIRQSIPA